MATPQTLNPNQPLPVVLSSILYPPPVWPLPVADWKVLPVVPAGFPAGPFTSSYTGPVGTGTWPGPVSSPGTGLGGASGVVTAATVTNGGSGFTGVPAVTINTSTGTGAVIQAVVSGGAVTGLNVISGGSNYAPTDTITISGGSGTGATGTITVS